MLVPRPHLEGQGALPRLGQHHVGLEAVADLAPEPQPVEPTRSEHDRVEAALPTLPQARVDVAPQRLDRERFVERQQLRLPSHRGCPDPHSRSQLLRTAERVPGIVAAEISADHQTFGIRGGHVLRGVDGDVDPPLEQRLLELFHEDPARADLTERTGAVAVTGRRDRDERELDAGRSQRRESALGLGEREPTGATADADEHRRVASARAARNQHRAAGPG